MKKQYSKPHQLNLRKARFSQQGAAYSITKCVDRRLVPFQILDRQDVALLIIEELSHLRTTYDIRIGGFIIMRDHIHFIIGLCRAIKFKKIMNQLFGRTAREINILLERNGKLWQTGYYEHCLRSDESFIKHLNYMHENPVRKGYVDKPEKWRYSTANKEFKDMIDWEWFAPFG